VTVRLKSQRRKTPPDERPRDLLTAMLEMTDAHGQGLSDSSVQFELIGLLIGGTETSAITTLVVARFAGATPDVQARLVEEVDSVLRGRPPPPTTAPTCATSA